MFSLNATWTVYRHGYPNDLLSEEFLGWALYKGHRYRTMLRLSLKCFAEGQYLSEQAYAVELKGSIAGEYGTHHNASRRGHVVCFSDRGIRLVRYADA